MERLGLELDESDMGGMQQEGQHSRQENHQQRYRV